MNKTIPRITVILHVSVNISCSKKQNIIIIISHNYRNSCVMVLPSPIDPLTKMFDKVRSMCS